MSLEAYARFLIEQWERGIRDAEDVVREIRQWIHEEDEIRAIAAEEIRIQLDPDDPRP